MSEWPQPWWSRASNVSVENGCGSCKFRTLVSTECKIEANQQGAPQKKCQRIFRKFKECPGRPAEVVERVEESTTEPNFKQDASPWKALGDSKKSSGEVISSEMGQLLEEVLAAFESDFILEGDSMHTMRHPVEWPSEEKHSGDDQQRINPGFFSRFFGRKPKSSTNIPGSTDPRVYGEYASDFQEVFEFIVHGLGIFYLIQRNLACKIKCIRSKLNEVDRMSVQ